jgi:hypothetical protein
MIKDYQVAEYPYMKINFKEKPESENEPNRTRTGLSKMKSSRTEVEPYLKKYIEPNRTNF